jgi:hypothetical protein
MGFFRRHVDPMWEYQAFGIGADKKIKCRHHLQKYKVF